MSKHPPLAMDELDDLLNGLEVEAIAFTECALERGWALTFGTHDIPSLHYVIQGEGSISLADGPSIALPARSLVISPPGQSYRLEVRAAPSRPNKRVAGSTSAIAPGGDIYRNYAGATGVDTIFVCGHFRARHPAAINLFTELQAPIIEQFGSEEAPDALFFLLRRELAQHKVGMKAMASALLKQVLVQMFRRALASSEDWRDRLTMLGDPQIARAFLAMRADPAAAHSIESLAGAACLSRSAFISRFTRAFGMPPSTMARRLRLDRAGELLRGGRLSTGQVASLVGYASYSSFSRAFLKHHHIDPSAFASGSSSKPTADRHAQ